MQGYRYGRRSTNFCCVRSFDICRQRWFVVTFSGLYIYPNNNDREKAPWWINKLENSVRISKIEEEKTEKVYASIKCLTIFYLFIRGSQQCAIHICCSSSTFPKNFIFIAYCQGTINKFFSTNITILVLSMEWCEW